MLSKTQKTKLCCAAFLVLIFIVQKLHKNVLEQFIKILPTMYEILTGIVGE